MTCEKIRNELVAYRDGELSERDHARVAQHLGTCAACNQTDAQFALVGQLVSKMECITPSADFAANFRLRLAQEDYTPQESGFVSWWRDLLSSWQLTPVLVGAASVLIFFGYWFTNRSETPSTLPTIEAPAQVAVTIPAPPEPVAERPVFFANYNVLANMEKLAHFEEIAAAQEQAETAPAKAVAELEKEERTEDLPPALLRDPSFFADYPMLRQMEKLQNMEAVLTVPTEGDSQNNRG